MDLEDVLLPQPHQDDYHHDGRVVNSPSSSVTASDSVSGRPLRNDLPRPASYTSVPRAQEHSDASWTFSEDDLVPTKMSWTSESRKDEPGVPHHEQEWLHHQPYVYSKSATTPSDSRITVQRTLLVQGHGVRQTQSPPPPEEVTSSIRTIPLKGRNNEEPVKSSASEIDTTSKGRLTKSLSFARKVKSARDGSPSPEKMPDDSTPNQTSAALKVFTSSKKGKFFSRENSQRSPQDVDRDSKEEKGLARSLSRGRSRLSKKSTKTAVGGTTGDQFQVANGSALVPTKAPVTPLTKSFSNSSIPSLVHQVDEVPSVPPLPSTIPPKKINPVQEKPAIHRDDLWSVFRDLESDFTKFQNKSTALKANVVRSTLLPFLRNFAQHPLNKTLRPEDIDRRTNILGRWWTGLLSLVHGKTSSTLSGSDRPTILEGIAGIMERTEWRYPPSPFSSITDQADGSTHSRSKSAASTGSDEFLIESVHHNVRNAFVQNLFAQMVYVVERMSLRHAPASLISFCGKACAYAFFFCPGVANILVHLWEVKASALQKILRADHIDTSTDLAPAIDLATLNFPACLHSVIFKSLKETSKQMRQPPLLPLGFDKIDWWGHWLSRWSGRDSELFYTFIRHYHSLLLDFLPPRPSAEQVVTAPGFVLVQAQMLCNLESTIHRQSVLDSGGMTGANAQITFEEMLSANNPAPTLSPSPLNSVRVMSENRFIALLQDPFTRQSSRSAVFFVSSFSQVLRAALSSTSLYDQSACFTLCDFLQEALTVPALLNPGDTARPLSLEWPFLVDVFRKMVHSENTTTEIRLYAMIFSIWDSILDVEAWRDSLCFNFLLDEDHFMRSFNHWCPMVRAYYMRLICWRLGRYDGDATEEDVKTLKILFQRLQTVWAYYKQLDDIATRKKVLRPSTSPCNPAPGRKLLIIRTDTHSGTPLISFNNMLSDTDDTRTARPSLAEDGNSNSVISAASLLERVSATLEYGVDISRKRSSIFRSWLGSRSNETPPRSPSPKQNETSSASPPRSNKTSNRTSPDRNGSRLSLYEQRPQPLNLDKKSKEVKSLLSSPKKPRYSPADFRFSLEAVDRTPENTPGDLDLEPPRLPLAAHLLLQSQADFQEDSESCEIPSRYASNMRYAGRALAEWTWVVNECQNFFERRRSEGVPSNRQVETPDLGVEPFRRLG